MGDFPFDVSLLAWVDTLARSEALLSKVTAVLDLAQGMVSQSQGLSWLPFLGIVDCDVEGHKGRQVELIEFICKKLECIRGFLLKLGETTLGLKGFLNKPNRIVSLEVIRKMRVKDSREVQVTAADLHLGQVAVDLALELKLGDVLVEQSEQLATGFVFLHFFLSFFVDL